jgi:hypothetical protein
MTAFDQEKDIFIWSSMFIGQYLHALAMTTLLRLLLVYQVRRSIIGL